MTSKLHIKNGKRSALRELLLKTDRRRLHHLYLSSCYFTPASASRLIKELADEIKLTDVAVYIDRKTANFHGKEKLEQFCRSTNYEVNLFAVNSSNLFHSKAYALISYDEAGNISCGSLVLGSANLTGNGLNDDSRGNVECLLDTQDIEDLDEFISQLESLDPDITNLDEIENFKSSDSFAFKYALLQCGEFVHKWTDNLAQYFAIKYRLNAYGRSRIADPIFDNMGFNVETATISKKYFEFDYEPAHLEDAENLTRTNGIETYLGYWVPRSSLSFLFKKDGIDEFKERLFSSLEEQYSYIKNKIENDTKSLLEAGIIEADDSGPMEKFDNKIKNLKENEYKIMRIFSKYEVFKLPYDIQEKGKIEDLFDEMVGLCESSQRKNVAKRGFLRAIEEVNLEMLNEIGYEE